MLSTIVLMSVDSKRITQDAQEVQELSETEHITQSMKDDDQGDVAEDLIKPRRARIFKAARNQVHPITPGRAAPRKIEDGVLTAKQRERKHRVQTQRFDPRTPFRELLKARPAKVKRILHLMRKDASWQEKKQKLDEQTEWNSRAEKVENALLKKGFSTAGLSKLVIDDATLGYVPPKSVSVEDFTDLAEKLPDPNGVEAKYLLEQIRLVNGNKRTLIPRDIRQAIYNSLPKELQQGSRGALGLADQSSRRS